MGGWGPGSESVLSGNILTQFHLLQLINFYQGLCLSLAVSSLATLGLSTFSDQWEGAMVVGEAGLGKSTLVNSMFMTDIYRSEESELSPGPAKTVRVETHSVVLQEGGVKLSLNVVDTPGKH